MMNFCCRRNQIAHVKLNLVHKLYCLHGLASQPLEYFKHLVTRKDLADAAKKQKSEKKQTWYALTQDCLINILYQVRFLNHFV